MIDLKNRLAQEKKSYDEGTVLEKSTQLQTKFKHVFQCPNSKFLEYSYEKEIARLLPNANILDYGCYNGWMIPYYQKFNPKKITGIDLSEKGIKSAKERYGHLAEFHLCDAHNMPFENGTFDVVIGRAILHHLDFNVALTEIYRVLRSGGFAVFIEPLGDNPIAKLIRKMTPQSRTVDEKPLSRNQILFADKLFGGRTNHVYANLVSVPIGLITSLFPLKSDNILLQITHPIDKLIAHTPMKYWMRSAMLSWSKR
jgi:SAM-dependent methyltransferase